MLLDVNSHPLVAVFSMLLEHPNMVDLRPFNIEYRKQNRRNRLAILLAERGQAEVGRLAGIDSAYLWQIAKGSGKSARTLSDTNAEKIETALSLGKGWFDVIDTGEPAPPPSPTTLAHHLVGLATPRSRRALERIIEAAKAGRLSEADLLLLESLAERFMTPAQPGAVSAALHRKAKGHAPSGA